MYTPSNITNPDLIHKELDEIQVFLEAPYAADLSDQVQSRFDSLAAYMARSGKLKADAEFHYNSLLESSIMEVLKKGYEERLSASTVNKFVEAAARNYKYLFTWAERSNRSLTHQYEGMRTVISKLKEEAAAMRWQK